MLHVRGSKNTLVNTRRGPCGPGCAYGRQLGMTTYYCFRPTGWFEANLGRIVCTTYKCGSVKAVVVGHPTSQEFEPVSKNMQV